MNRNDVNKRKNRFYIIMLCYFDATCVFTPVMVYYMLKKEGNLTQEFTIDRWIMLILVLMLFVGINIRLIGKIRKTSKKAQEENQDFREE